MLNTFPLIVIEDCLGKKMHYPYGECEKNLTPFAILFFLVEDGKKQQMTITLLNIGQEKKKLYLGAKSKFQRKL